MPISLVIGDHALSTNPISRTHHGTKRGRVPHFLNVDATVI
jgi:hypothetical protein